MPEIKRIKKTAPKKMSAQQIMKQVVSAASDAKGKDVVVLDVSKVSDIASYFVIVSGRSDRQVQGISNRILDDLTGCGAKPFSTDGLEKGHWVLIDYSDVVVHVFYEPIREHYNLEALWASAKRVRIGAQSASRKAA